MTLSESQVIRVSQGQHVGAWGLCGLGEEDIGFLSILLLCICEHVWKYVAFFFVLAYSIFVYSVSFFYFLLF